MKNLKMVKSLLILIMSIGIILTFSNFVYADDDDPFLELTPTNTESNEAANTSNENSTNTDTNNTLFTNTNSNTGVNSLTTNNTVVNNTTNNTANNVNRSVTNTETLAKTGISDSKGMVTLIVIICGISAVYSYKKINDYKKL